MKFSRVTQSVIVTKYQSGYRLDKALSKLLLDCSRSQIKNWIFQKKVRINNVFITIPKKKVFSGERIELCNISKNVIQEEKAENIPLNIVYEDDFILIINKSSNFVVHPGSGHSSGTVLNALLHYYPPIAFVPRAGIVQRLDKDTTGLMLIAKDVITQRKLVQLFRLRKVIREYEAIVVGNIPHGGVVNKPIARHVVNRTSMCVCLFGKPAVTYYQVIENFTYYTRIKLQLKTGRTHQIRVHMSHICHPVVGDQKYGGSINLRIPKEKYKLSNGYFFNFNRQALHASMLEFSHPITGIRIVCEISLSKDIETLLKILRLGMVL